MKCARSLVLVSVHVRDFDAALSDGYLVFFLVHAFGVCWRKLVLWRSTSTAYNVHLVRIVRVDIAVRGGA